MNLTYGLVSIVGNISIEELARKVDNLNEKINLIDSNVKFNISIYWVIVTLVIGVLGAISWIEIKNDLERKAEKYISERLENIINRIDKYKVLSGSKRLYEDELNDGVYSFEIGSDKLNISFGKDSKVYINPLQGSGELEYDAEVIDGILKLKFMNFDAKLHKGVEWKVIYLE